MGQKTAACYVRVSTEEQHKYGISVDAQVAALTEHCEANGYIPAVYNDAGYSARKSYKTRPELQRLMEDCRAGRIDVIIFTKLDRLTRSVGDYYAIMEQCGGVPWRAIHEDYETETPGGVLKVNIMLSVSQNEADQTSLRIKRTNDFKRANGEPCSGAIPLGYRIRNKHLEFDPETHDAVDAFFRSYLRTFSLTRAIEAAEDAGAPKNCMTTWIKRLRNPVYRGTASYGSVPAYITEAEYEAIDRNIKRRAHRTGRDDKIYIFSGLLSCGTCGLSLHGRTAKCVSQTEKTGKRYVYPYYLCAARVGRIDMQSPCSGVYANEGKLEKEMVRRLAEYLDNYDVQVKSEPKQKDNSQKISRLEEKQRRLKELYIDLEISKEEYERRKASITEEIKSLQPRPAQKKPEVPDNWQEIYWGLNLENRRAFWRAVVKRIVVFNRNTVSVEWL